MVTVIQDDQSFLDKVRFVVDNADLLAHVTRGSKLETAFKGVATARDVGHYARVQVQGMRDGVRDGIEDIAGVTAATVAGAAGVVVDVADIASEKIIGYDLYENGYATTNFFTGTNNAIRNSQITDVVTQSMTAPRMGSLRYATDSLLGPVQIEDDFDQTVYDISRISTRVSVDAAAAVGAAVVVLPQSAVAATTSAIKATPGAAWSATQTVGSAGWTATKAVGSAGLSVTRTGLGVAAKGVGISVAANPVTVGVPLALGTTAAGIAIDQKLTDGTLTGGVLKLGEVTARQFDSDRLAETLNTASDFVGPDWRDNAEDPDTDLGDVFRVAMGGEETAPGQEPEQSVIELLEEKVGIDLPTGNLPTREEFIQSKTGSLVSGAMGGVRDAVSNGLSGFFNRIGNGGWLGKLGLGLATMLGGKWFLNKIMGDNTVTNMASVALGIASVAMLPNDKKQENTAEIEQTARAEPEDPSFDFG